MDDVFLRDVLEKERHREIELTGLLTTLASAPLEHQELIIRDIGNKTLHSCGGPTGVVGIPLILDVCFPFVMHEKMGTHMVSVHRKPQELGTSAAELFKLGRTLTQAYASMTYRIYVAYQIDLVAKGYTGDEADDMAFYLSRKETYFPWYKTPGTNLRKFISVFDIFDISAEDVGLNSETIHQDTVRFYQIWIKYFPRRTWDSLVKHIISDRWIDHGQIGMLANRISPMEVDPEVAGMLRPDGLPINEVTNDAIVKKFGMMFEGNRLARLADEADASDDDIRVRQLRFICHTGRLNTKPHPTFSSLVWGARSKG